MSSTSPAASSRCRSAATRASSCSRLSSMNGLVSSAAAGVSVPSGLKTLRCMIGAHADSGSSPFFSRSISAWLGMGKGVVRVALGEGDVQ
jgi:hypothetical protein